MTTPAHPQKDRTTKKEFYKNLYPLLWCNYIVTIIRKIYKLRATPKIMELKTILDNKNLMKEFEKPEITGFSSENSIEKIGQEKIFSLKKAIAEIKKLIEERSKLSKEFIADGDAIKLEIDNFILINEGAIRTTTSGQNEGLIEKNSLRNKKVEISELQLKEKIDCWKDIALLKKELRIYEKELNEKENRINELNDILGEN